MPVADATSLKIIHYPDPRLRQTCKPIEVFDDALAAMAGKMLDLMHASRGVGLAAPQVAVLDRLFVCNATGDRKDDLVFVNPQLTDFDGEAMGDEGCLSIPDVTVDVRRAAQCRIVAQNLKGETFEMVGHDLLARIWQHETDHLDARLIVDVMSEADKIANRRAVKKLEQDYKGRKR